jgi:hypothetical protein
MSTTEIIAAVAALFTGIMLWVQLQNFRERRHGEIVQLRTQALTDLSDLRHRVSQSLIQTEGLRRTARMLPEGDPKYELVESIPRWIGSGKGTIEKLDVLINRLEDFAPDRSNSARSLKMLRGITADLIDLQRTARTGEDNILRLAELAGKVIVIPNNHD